VRITGLEEAAGGEETVDMSKTAVTERKPVAKPPAKARKGITIRHKPAPVVEKPAAATPADVIGPVCVHRWVIESPNGETSRGRCRYCGAEKDFPNAAEDGLWERNVPQSRWTGRSDWKPQDSGY
jgi:hypothetical protein